MQISFDEKKHLYYAGDKLLPNVTTILKDVGITDYSWATEVDMNFGKALHKTIELYHRNTLNREKLHPLLETRLQGYEIFLEATGWTPEKLELIVGSEKHWFAGTLDQTGKFTRGLKKKYLNKLTVLDIKTGDLNEGAEEQTGGYSIALNEGVKEKDKVKLRAAIQPTSEGFYKLSVFEDKRGEEAFLKALWLYKWKRRK